MHRQHRVHTTLLLLRLRHVGVNMQAERQSGVYEGQLNMTERQLLSDQKAVCGDCLAAYSHQYNTRTLPFLSDAQELASSLQNITSYKHKCIRQVLWNAYSGDLHDQHMQHDCTVCEDGTIPRIVPKPQDRLR